MISVGVTGGGLASMTSLPEVLEKIYTMMGVEVVIVISYYRCAQESEYE